MITAQSIFHTPLTVFGVVVVTLILAVALVKIVKFVKQIEVGCD